MIVRFLETHILRGNTPAASISLEGGNWQSDFPKEYLPRIRMETFAFAVTKG
jgi:hypothetical protein